jgi:DNA-binding response OmpR family regulator
MRGLKRVLLIHPDEALRGFVLRGLPKSEFQVTTAANGSQGLARIEKVHPHIVIVAEEQSRLNGNSLLSEVRQTCNAPIIVLGSRDRELAGAKLLEMGADAYIPKPLRLTELTSRIYSLIRRFGGWNAPPPGRERYRGAYRDTDLGERISLSPTESRLLSCLKRNEGKVVPSYDIISEVWDGRSVSTDLLKVYVRRLRQKLSDDPGSPALIHNERGVGYRWGNGGSDGS